MCHRCGPKKKKRKAERKTDRKKERRKEGRSEALGLGNTSELHFPLISSHYTEKILHLPWTSYWMLVKVEKIEGKPMHCLSQVWRRSTFQAESRLSTTGASTWASWSGSARRSYGCPVSASWATGAWSGRGGSRAMVSTWPGLALLPLSWSVAVFPSILGLWPGLLGIRREEKPGVLSLISFQAIEFWWF